jgi:glutamate racemase
MISPVNGRHGHRGSFWDRRRKEQTLLSDISAMASSPENSSLIQLPGGISVQLTPARADLSLAGVIDSGVGGASVRNELLDKTGLRPNELISCLAGQTVGGIPAEKTRMIFRDMVFATLGNYPSVRAFVVACNTFAGIGAEAIIREVAAAKGITEKIFIITPIRQAVERIKAITSVQAGTPVVIMATDATCRLNGPQFPASYQSVLRTSGIDSLNNPISFRPEQALIDLIQKGEDDSVGRELERIVENDLLSMVPASNRLIIVLGCTHFHRGIEDALRVSLGRHGVEANFINTNELVVTKTIDAISQITSLSPPAR